MKILVNTKIKAFFYKIMLCIVIFTVIAWVLITYPVTNAALYIFLCALCMAVVILVLCYRNFKEQQRMIEHAAAQITEYIAGNKEARIECNSEGELYHFFQEVNSLVSILNAHAENEVRAKDFLKNTIADISHQLKTPLAALNVYNGILQSEAKMEATIQEFTALSEQELDRIETLVQNLLKITKLDAGTIMLEKHSENVADMIECVCKHFQFRAEQEQKTICMAGADDIILLCDREWLMEAIGNIVKNALDHTEKGGEIQAAWKQFASVVQITIKDNGSGIHSEDLYYIFKRFYRSKYPKETAGIGLGLPLAQTIIEAHNGTIEVESEWGVGTTFVIDFLYPTKL